jgi:glycosyltransferase involved in cell wall biosynthesis
MRPRLLFLSHRLPFPPHNGAAIRTYNILRLLARDFELQALCFDRRDPATATIPLDRRVAALEGFGRIEVFPIPQELSRARLVWDHGRSVFTGRAYTFYLHDQRAFVRRVGECVRSGAFSLVHLDSFDLYRFADLAGRLPVICTHHNVESQLLARRAVAERNPLRRSYLAFQARRIRSAERTAAPRMALNVMVSPEDAAELEAIAPGARTLVVPNGVDTDFFRPGSEDQPGGGLVFVGGTSWFPNRDALEWFAAEILPRLRARGIGEPAIWVGRATEEERSRFGRDGLTLTGYVDDIRPYLQRALCFIAPLRVGGGTRLKLLDAWAMGKAVVSTSRGAEGLAVQHGINMLIADTADAFVSCVAQVLEDRQLRSRLGREGRATVERGYSWEVIGARMSGAYRALL